MAWRDWTSSRALDFDHPADRWAHRSSVRAGAGSLAAAFGLAALGGVAVGAFAVGALAVWRLAVDKMAVREGRFERLEIGELDVERLRANGRPVMLSAESGSSSGSSFGTGSSAGLGHGLGSDIDRTPEPERYR